MPIFRARRVLAYRSRQHHDHMYKARIRQLEGQRELDWAPQPASSRESPYGISHTTSAISSSSGDRPKRREIPDWTVLRELGAHVIDEDGFSRYMGPSAGVGFAAKILQEVLNEDQPAEPEYYCLFSLDDFKRARHLERADTLLWEVVPSNPLDRQAVGEVLGDFFNFTERVFPILHRPSFMKVVDELYSLETTIDRFEMLGQLYFALSIGHGLNPNMSLEERTNHQIGGLQTGARCLYTTMHTRREGLTRVQTLALHSYALILLRQRSEGRRINSMATAKALECGLHHDGKQFTGKPLKTEMRRRVFWCVFMLHMFNSSLEGLLRALHEADITISEPSDIDDEHLTPTEVLNSVPGRTKIHRFVSICRLVRIMSRTLDVLYTHNKRKQASTRIEQMNRLCCEEHLLDQLDFGSEERDDIPDPETTDLSELAVLSSYASEQALYHYIRWLIHRPGLALPQSDPQFASSLQSASDAAAGLLRIMDVYKRTMPFIKANPGAHPCTVFITSLTPLYRTFLLKAMPGTIPMLGYSTDADIESIQQALQVLEFASHDPSVRRRVLQKLLTAVFGDDHAELYRLTSIRSQGEVTMPGFESTNQPSTSHEQDMSRHSMEYHEQQLEHLSTHEELQNLVYDTFSPNMEHWRGDYDFSNQLR